MLKKMFAPILAISLSAVTLATPVYAEKSLPNPELDSELISAICIDFNEEFGFEGEALSRITDDSNLSNESHEAPIKAWNYTETAKNSQSGYAASINITKARLSFDDFLVASFWISLFALIVFSLYMSFLLKRAARAAEFIERVLNICEKLYNINWDDVERALREETEKEAEKDPKIKTKKA